MPHGSSPAVSVCSATVVHAPVFAALHGLAFSRPWEESDFRALLQDPTCFGFLALTGTPETQDQNAGAVPTPCGLVLFRSVLDEAEILTVGIAPTARRQGIASRLISTALAEADIRGAEHIFLEVAASNTAAQALYQTIGFQISGRRRNYYHTDAGGLEDALVMTLTLPDTTDRARLRR